MEEDEIHVDLDIEKENDSNNTSKPTENFSESNKDDNEIVRVRSLLKEKKDKRAKQKPGQEKTKFDVALETLISANSASVSNDNTEDEYSSFGKSIAFQLRKMSPLLSIEAMSEIQRISTEYRLKSIFQEQSLDKVKSKNIMEHKMQTKNNTITHTQVKNQKESKMLLQNSSKLPCLAKKKFDTVDLSSSSASSPSTSSHISFGSHMEDEEYQGSCSANLPKMYNTNTILDQALFSDMFNE